MRVRLFVWFESTPTHLRLIFICKIYFITEKEAFVAIGVVCFVVFLFIGFVYNKCDNCGEYSGIIHKASCTLFDKKDECCKCGKTMVIINTSENNSSDELILCEVCKEKITNISTINNIEVVKTNENENIISDSNYCFECGSLNKKN